jgi:peptidoglycan/LPS O-acetylase OafA/YrhL
VTHRPTTGFLPALDGLRGIAIILVMVHHFTVYRPTEGLDKWVASIPLIGWAGVDLFFVLSGFLITGILIDTRGHQRYFTSFYARRTLRIFPLYYLVLFLTLVLLPLSVTLHDVLVGPYDLPPLWPYWVYLSNFSIADRGLVHGLLDISWSLAVEEQFYLVWAVVIWLCPPRLLGPLCAAIIVAEPIARWTAIARGVEPLSIYVLTWFRLDGLATGSLLAWLMRRGAFPALDRLAPAATITLGAALIAVIFLSGDGWWWHGQMQRWGYSIIALLGGALLVMAISRPEDHFWPRALSAGWLRACGKYSYCMYLVHLPVQRAMSAYGFDPNELELVAPWIGQGMFYLAAGLPTFGISWVSWRIFEEPILRLKEKFPY